MNSSQPGNLMKQMLSHSPYSYNDQSTWMVCNWSPGCIMWDNKDFSLCVIWFLECEWHIFCYIKVLHYVFCGDWMDPLYGLPRLSCHNEWTGSCSHITTNWELLCLSVFSAPHSTVVAVSGWTYRSWKAQSCINWSVRKGNNIFTHILPNIARTLYSPGDLDIQPLLSICHLADSWK